MKHILVVPHTVLTLSEKPNLRSLTVLAAELEAMFFGLNPRAPPMKVLLSSLLNPKKEVSLIYTGPS